MADEVIPVSQQSQWRVGKEVTTKYFTGTDALSDPGAYVQTDDLANWATDLLATSGQRVLVDLTSLEANNLALKFFGAPASTWPGTGQSLKQYEGQVALWGVSEMTDDASPTPNIEYAAEYLGKLVVVVGKTAGVVPVSNPILPDTPAPYFVRQILVQEDHSIFPAFRIVGEEGEAAPILVVDTIGYSRVIVEMRRQTGPDAGLPAGVVEAATALGFLYRVI